MAKNLLYYGDNLDILRRYVPDESVDLIYLDPPFKSEQDYNVLFEERNGTMSKAQIKAFEDTWRWDRGAAEAYADVLKSAPDRVCRAMRGFFVILGTNDMLAYLSMMAPRLVEMHRVLKPTGSIYLHCDPAASAYLRLLMDAVFGPENFLNEVIWKRTHAHSGARRYGPIHDNILFYCKSGGYVWNPPHTGYSEDYTGKFFRFEDPDGRRYRLTILTGSGTRAGSSGEPWRGIDPASSGRHWAVPGYARKLLPNPNTATVQEALDQLDAIGRVVWPKKQGGMPAFKQYLDDLPGVALQDIWTDIPPISSQASERLGYPTQKPMGLLERIINASSNEGDVVLDPFCGCGTTIAAAQKLNRQWIGIDITYLAVALIKHRLRDTFGEKVMDNGSVRAAVEYEVVGEPVALSDAQALAEQDPYQFQWWALGLLDARPVEQKKGKDKGIDGRLYFFDEPDATKTKQIIFQVKAGQTGPADVRDLRGVIERENAEIGVLITLKEPTREMRSEAAAAGFYVPPVTLNEKYPRIQILTVSELLQGKRVEYPARSNITFRKAPKAKRRSPNNPGLFSPSSQAGP